ncbi:DUF2199 domain-containing protein [Nocardia cyriacigeorgica]|uniref:DUF2199 domain-containing protein n=1 Tax=Nocardia cyriacigeorgica TaxID=135487 RepID=UPI002455B210|nr:DUF2199 domain-containing protein [Nocardia cyriacigeorgica]
MSTDLGFRCSSCGQDHDDLPFTYGAVAPAYWSAELVGGVGNVLGDERCVIADEHFFVRARVVLPVLDAAEDFEWGVWVSLSRDNFRRVSQLWNSPERVDEPSYFGWMATELPIYELTTINLKTRMHSQPVGIRPTLELEPTDHPLAVDQRTGITLARVQGIAERLLHPR